MRQGEGRAPPYMNIFALTVRLESDQRAPVNPNAFATTHYRYFEP
jgi:hypothetical protein